MVTICYCLTDFLLFFLNFFYLQCQVKKTSSQSDSKIAASQITPPKCKQDWKYLLYNTPVASRQVLLQVFRDMKQKLEIGCPMKHTIFQLSKRKLYTFIETRQMQFKVCSILIKP